MPPHISYIKNLLEVYNAASQSSLSTICNITAPYPQVLSQVAQWNTGTNSRSNTLALDRTGGELKPVLYALNWSALCFSSRVGSPLCLSSATHSSEYSNTYKLRMTATDVRLTCLCASIHSACYSGRPKQAPVSGGYHGPASGL